MVQMVVTQDNLHSLSHKFRNCGDGLQWVFRGNYGPTNRVLREEVWEDLGAIRGVQDDLWCVGGDINVLKFPRRGIGWRVDKRHEEI